jgi:hypothetical protein
MQGLETLMDVLRNGNVYAEIWIDGSFITKKLDPNDVDILICASAETYENFAPIRALLDWADQTDLRPQYHSDSYLQLDYPESHPLRVLSEKTKDSWR